LQLDYSLGFIAVCLGAGIVYAGILYFKNKQFSLPVLIGVSALRFLLISFICFLLLSPTTRVVDTEIEKPKVLWLQDNSISAGLEVDSSAWVANYQEKSAALADELNVEWITIPFSDGNESQEAVNFSGTTTNLSDVLSNSYDSYFNQNIAAIVLSSDGIYNRGYDPRYVNNNSNWPLYTWVLGDTALQIDGKIEKVYHNKIAYKGNQFPIEVNTSVNVDYDNLRVTLKKDGKTLQSKTLKNGESSSSFQFFHTESKVGLQSYRIELQALNGEKNLTNNVQLVYINIVENKKKIVFVTKQTHPDIGAFKSALKEIEEYDFKVVKADDVLAPFKDVDLLILHQLPSKGDRKLSNYISSFKGNVLYLTGEQTSFNYLNRYQKFFAYQAGTEMESVGVHGSAAFTKFNLEDDVRAFFQNAPKLWSNQKNIEFYGSHEHLYQSKIFNLNTEQPVMSFGELAGRTYGLINGEGFWQWKLYDFRENQNHDNFNTLIRQMVRYLVSKESLQRFRLDMPSRILGNKPLKIEAELYNPAYELSTAGKITLALKHENGEDFKYTLNPSGNVYRSTINGLPSGKYTYSALAEIGDETFIKKGGLFIEPVEIELIETRANYALMKALSSKNAGAVFRDGDWDKLEERLRALDPPSISHQNEKMEQWINLKTLFFLILGLLTLEWFLRKRNGSY